MSFSKISIALAMTVGFTTVAVAGDAKAPGTAKAPAKEAPKKMEMPKPPAEMAEMSKMMLGTWKCTGKAMMDPSKPTEMSDMKSTMKFVSDKKLGGWWVTGTMDSPMFKGTMFVTYDTNAKKFYSVMVDNMGASQTSWSTGMKENKMLWEGDARSSMPGMATMKVRDTHDMTDAKAGYKMVGEMSMDGKTWMKGWEATCKK
ncbi:MAG: DUF1579 family protein [Deltaproteobacteria bacterium]|nr:DUF1579 family protein [Deltaproteobacteria bacterium]